MKMRQTAKRNGHVTHVQTATSKARKTAKSARPEHTSQFIQTASGEFSFYGRAGFPHCGPNAGRINCGYEVLIDYPDAQLDPDGFLLNSLYFGEYFGAFREAQVSISCEKLAKLAASDICAEILTSGRTCNSVQVRVSPHLPTGNASMVATVTPATLAAIRPSASEVS